ncbi:MAG TPA: PadR family transcriptional regulator [Chryseosolibacter sp.]|nr:PadR family transcriptional regulator [Chryseosolibacter sp.]
MKREFLGEFEELVLTIVATLSSNAYGQTVMNAIIDLTGRDVTISAVHTTLYRLEDKGLLHSEMSGNTNKKGGRSKRIFKATVAGLATLRNMKAVRESMWKLIPMLKD